LNAREAQTSNPTFISAERKREFREAIILKITSTAARVERGEKHSHWNRNPSTCTSARAGSK